MKKQTKVIPGEVLKGKTPREWKTEKRALIKVIQKQLNELYQESAYLPENASAQILAMRNKAAIVADKCSLKKLGR